MAHPRKETKPKVYIKNLKQLILNILIEKMNIMMKNKWIQTITLVIPSKNGGLLMYVEFESHGYNLPCGASNLFHRSLPVVMRA